MKTMIYQSWTTRPTPMQWAAHQLALAAQESQHELPPSTRSRAKAYFEKTRDYEPIMLNILKNADVPITATKITQSSSPPMNYYIVCSILEKLVKKGVITMKKSTVPKQGSKIFSLYSLAEGHRQ